ncbi:hypothetical protein ACOI1A_00865 [Corynebacterium glutamicum]|uniref:hypothetical protein n=1 Tax=Corynebacterium glutamicum TaxID=1718 RepID=UPI003B5A94FE
MMNANKRKGDRAERAVRDHLALTFPTKKTRAGFDDDLGDVIAETPRGLFTFQVKDVASPPWKTWWEQLASQVTNLRSNTEKAVRGGAIVHKVRGQGTAGRWRVVMELDQFIELLNEE